MHANILLQCLQDPVGKSYWGKMSSYQKTMQQQQNTTNTEAVI